MSPPTLHRARDLAAVAGPLLREAIEEVVAARGRCRLALSGGSTPGGTLRWLADNLSEDTVPHLDVTFVDERAVPQDHPDANVRLARAAWLDRAPGVTVYPMFLGGTLEEARAAFEAVLRGPLAGGVDVVLLGAGPDGHIGSLFPGQPALDEQQRLCAAVADSPKPPPERLTLTLPVLDAARWVILLARGENKAAALRRAWDGDASLPLGRLAPRGHYHWVLDEAAAQSLPAGPPEDG